MADWKSRFVKYLAITWGIIGISMLALVVYMHLIFNDDSSTALNFSILIIEIFFGVGITVTVTLYSSKENKDLKKLVNKQSNLLERMDPIIVEQGEMIKKEKIINAQHAANIKSNMSRYLDEIIDYIKYYDQTIDSLALPIDFSERSIKGRNILRNELKDHAESILSRCDGLSLSEIERVQDVDISTDYRNVINLAKWFFNPYEPVKNKVPDEIKNKCTELLKKLPDPYEIREKSVKRSPA